MLESHQAAAVVISTIIAIPTLSGMKANGRKTSAAKGG